MNNDWKTFLLSKNAKLENSHVLNFGLTTEDEQAAYSDLILADLSHYALIKASGEDVVDFFQGQTTNDIKLVTENTSQLSAYCNPKGRILASFRIFKRNNHYFLRLQADTIDATIKRLRMFVMRSKVELVDSSDELSRMGVAGINATVKLKGIFNNLPENTDDSLTENDVTIIKLPGTIPAYEIHAPTEQLIVMWEKLQDDAVLVGKNSWNLLTIRAGIPEIVADTVEAFVPQMVNLQAINSLSFTKGCYPGQEVVARMHYLGKVKRRLYLGSANSEHLPLPGEIIATGTEKEEKAGQIVTASWSKDKIVEFLAVIQIEKAENEELHLESSNGAIIQLSELPYSLEKDEKK